MCVFRQAPIYLLWTCFIHNAQIGSRYQGVSIWLKLILRSRYHVYVKPGNLLAKYHEHIILRINHMCTSLLHHQYFSFIRNRMKQFLVLGSA